MAKTRDDPRLGRLLFDGGREWQTVVRAPSFNAFSYDAGVENDGNYRLCIEVDHGSSGPPEAALALAARVVAQQAVLPGRVAAALWDEFSGRRPESRNWWRRGLGNCLPRVIRLGTRPPREVRLPTAPDDVLALLRLFEIRIHDHVLGYRGPLAELAFNADIFEPEHGVGVLTDGDAIVGTGYYLDVLPYGVE